MDLAQAKEIWKDLQSIVGDGKVSGLKLGKRNRGWTLFLAPKSKAL